MPHRPDRSDEPSYAADLTSVAGVQRPRFYPQAVVSGSGSVLTYIARSVPVHE